MCGIWQTRLGEKQIKKRMGIPIAMTLMWQNDQTCDRSMSFQSRIEAFWLQWECATIWVVSTMNQ